MSEHTALREAERDLRSRLACVMEATYWDRPYDERIAAIRGMCDLTTDGMTPVYETPGVVDCARGPMTVDLNGCARCHGEGHPGLTFTPLTHPLEISGEALTHWAPCPTNGEPILMQVRQSVPEED